MTSPYRIHVDNVSLRYFTQQGETQALQNINLSVKPGEFISIIGKSG